MTAMFAPPNLLSNLCRQIATMKQGDTEHPRKSVDQYALRVFFPSILDIKFVGRTSRGHTGFLIHLPSAVRALIFVARRIQPFLSLVDREVEFCVLVVFSLDWLLNHNVPLSCE